MVAVALHRSVYLWNAAHGSITHLCDIPVPGGNDYYSSVSFMPSTSDSFLALGDSLGSIQVLHAVVTRRVAAYLETHCNIGLKKVFPTGILDR